MNTGIILNELNEEGCKWISSTSDVLRTKFDISPQDFIKYAEIDLSSDYEHNIINALSNSKRALDCQLDTLMVAFGYYKKSQKEFWNFPKKLTLISDLGILAPRVLSKINTQRNLLEHQFIKPVKDQVEDFLDIAMLFIASTDRYSLKFITHLTFRNKELGKVYTLINDPSNESFQIIKSGEGVDSKEEALAIFVDTKDTHHRALLRKYLQFY